MSDFSERDRRDFDARRRAENPYRAWYSLAIWRQNLRPQQLSRQPLCVRCLERGDTTLAQVVNHKTPHKGDWNLFVDPNNHESVCKVCHDGVIKAEEMSRFKAVDADGWPVE